MAVYYISNVNFYIRESQIDSLLYNTTMTTPGGEKYDDYNLVFNMSMNMNAH